MINVINVKEHEELSMKEFCNGGKCHRFGVRSFQMHTLGCEKLKGSYRLTMVIVALAVGVAELAVVAGEKKKRGKSEIYLSRSALSNDEMVVISR